MTTLIKNPRSGERSYVQISYIISNNFDFRYIPFNMDGKYNKAFEGSLTDTTDTKNVSVDLVLQGVPTSFGWKASSKIIILIFFVKIIRQIVVRSALLNQNVNKI